jgi:hypothetical protein
VIGRVKKGGFLNFFRPFLAPSLPASGRAAFADLAHTARSLILGSPRLQNR